MEQDKCQVCGEDYVYRQEGRLQGSFCNKCSIWCVVTTYTMAIIADETRYELRIPGGDYRNDTHIKAVAKITGRNFLTARKLLQQKNAVILVDVATVVNEARKTLSESGVPYAITPPFPY